MSASDIEPDHADPTDSPEKTKPEEEKAEEAPEEVTKNPEQTTIFPSVTSFS